MTVPGKFMGFPDPGSAERRAVVAEAKTWLGTPWRHEARVKGGGVDCGMFLAGVFENVGMTSHLDIPHYPQDWAFHRGEERFLAVVELYAVKVERAALPGDVLLFKYGRCISHGAIVVEFPRFIHAYLGAGEVIWGDLSLDADLTRRLAGVWDPWGVR